MTERRKDVLAAAAIFAGALAADWSFTSKMFVFEGLARAMPIDVGRWRELTPGNYLAYGPLGWVFHHFLAALGFDQPAVYTLQLLDGLLGALGAAIQFSTLRRLGASRSEAAAWSAALASCFAWWLWSTDAQNYILSAVLLALVFRLLAERLAGGRVPAWAVGLAHAAALTGHVVNAVFVLPAALAIWLTEPKRTRARSLAVYAASFAAAGAAVYGLALGVFVRPQSAAQALRWLAGSANVGATADRVAWHGGLSLWSVGAWLKTTLDVFTTVWTARMLVLGAAIAAASRWRRLSGPRLAAAKVCGAWILSYALIFTSWEPQTLVYRVPDCVPLVTLLWLGLSTPRSGVIVAGVLLAANFFAEIRPRSIAANNPTLQRMLFVKEATPPGCFVTGDGGADELYLPYFAERAPLVLGDYVNDPDALTRRMDAIKARGGIVVVTSRALGDERWGPYFKKKKLEKFAARDGFELYFLR